MIRVRNNGHFSCEEVQRLASGLNMETIDNTWPLCHRPCQWPIGWRWRAAGLHGGRSLRPFGVEGAFFVGSLVGVGSEVVALGLGILCLEEAEKVPNLSDQRVRHIIEFLHQQVFGCHGIPPSKPNPHYRYSTMT